MGPQRGGHGDAQFRRVGKVPARPARQRMRPGPAQPFPGLYHMPYSSPRRSLRVQAASLPLQRVQGRRAVPVQRLRRLRPWRTPRSHAVLVQRELGLPDRLRLQLSQRRCDDCGGVDLVKQRLCTDGSAHVKHAGANKLMKKMETRPLCSYFFPFFPVLRVHVQMHFAIVAFQRNAIYLTIMFTYLMKFSSEISFARNFFLLSPQSKKNSSQNQKRYVHSFLCSEEPACDLNRNKQKHMARLGQPPGNTSRLRLIAVRRLILLAALQHSRLVPRHVAVALNKAAAAVHVTVAVLSIARQRRVVVANTAPGLLLLRLPPRGDLGCLLLALALGTGCSQRSHVNAGLFCPLLKLCL
eukprot:m.162697 g.162697  ORF g.162697 m.162697 type:complete len:354 (-) comp17095_c0_seq3:1502-2563(-)